jgi:hypothetical protein
MGKAYDYSDKEDWKSVKEYSEATTNSGGDATKNEAIKDDIQPLMEQDRTAQQVFIDSFSAGDYSQVRQPHKLAAFPLPAASLDPACPELPGAEFLCG